MGRKLIINKGDKFNRLTIIKELPIKKVRGGTERSFLCTCDCGNKSKVRLRSLRNGHTKSCGCYNKERTIETHTKHGASPRGGLTYEYRVWVGVRQRCNNSNDTNYDYYGGRGITICDRWSKFEDFLIDVGMAPTPKHTLDREDSNGNYNKENCSWQTMLVQSRKTRLLRSTNTSGRRGVSWHKGAGKWAAKITVAYKCVHLGLFTDKDDAARAFDKYVTENNLEHTKNFKG